MATARTSARKTQAELQREKFAAFYKFQRGRRIPSLSSKASSIAEKIQRAEDVDMINRYEDGLVSNEEFLSYLKDVLKRPSLSPSDRTKVLDTIRDTQVKIQVDALEAAYTEAPDRSLAKAEAARKIAQFYERRADEMVPGTPAYSNAMQQAARWNAQAESITTAVEKDSRALLRAQRELEISATTDTDSEATAAKAEMFYELAQEAAEDGDVLAAQKYQKMGNEKIQQAQELYLKEQRTQALRDLTNVEVQWHDGTISFDDAMTRLAEINGLAVELGDVNLMESVRNVGDRLAKDQAKGGLERGMVQGLPVVYGRSGSGTGGDILLSSGETAWEAEDNYIKQMREVQEKESKGEIDAQTATILKTKLVVDRYQKLKELEAVFNEIAETNPNAKVSFMGTKTKVGNALKKIESELYGDATNPFGERLPYSPLPKLGLEQVLQLNPELAQAIYDQYADVDIADLEEEAISELAGVIGGDYAPVVVQDEKTGEQKVIQVPKDERFNPNEYVRDAFGYYYQILPSDVVPGFESAEAAQAYLQQWFGGRGQVVMVDASGKPTEDRGEAVAWGAFTPQYIKDSEGDIWAFDEEWQQFMPTNPEKAQKLIIARESAPDQVEPGVIYTTEALERLIPESEEERQRILESIEAREIEKRGLVDYIEPRPEAGKITPSEVIAGMAGGGIVSPVQLRPEYITEKVKPAIQEVVKRVGKPVAEFVQKYEKPVGVATGILSGGVSITPEQVEQFKQTLKPVVERYTPGLTSRRAFAESFRQNIFTPGPGEGLIERKVREGVETLKRKGRDILSRLAPSWLKPKLPWQR